MTPKQFQILQRINAEETRGVKLVSPWELTSSERTIASKLFWEGLIERGSIHHCVGYKLTQSGQQELSAAKKNKGKSDANFNDERA